jgi:hypothetical protein
MPARIVTSVHLFPSSRQKTSLPRRCRIAFNAATARGVSGIFRARPPFGAPTCPRYLMVVSTNLGDDGRAKLNADAPPVTIADLRCGAVMFLHPEDVPGTQKDALRPEEPQPRAGSAGDGRTHRPGGALLEPAEPGPEHGGEPPERLEGVRRRQSFLLQTIIWKRGVSIARSPEKIPERNRTASGTIETG